MDSFYLLFVFDKSFLGDFKLLADASSSFESILETSALKKKSFTTCFVFSISWLFLSSQTHIKMLNSKLVNTKARIAIGINFVVVLLIVKISYALFPLLNDICW